MQKECKKYDHLKINALVYHEHMLIISNTYYINESFVKHVCRPYNLPVRVYIIGVYCLFQLGFSCISLLYVPDLIGEESQDKHNGLTSKTAGH